MVCEESISRAENEKYILELRYDMYADNPFEFDEYYDFFKIIAFHKRYTIGYDHGYKTPEDYLRSLLEDLYTEEYIDKTLDKLRSKHKKDQPYVYYEDIIYTFKKLSDKYIFFDLYFLDHSVFYVSIYSFNDPWDSGMLGWVVVDKEKMKEFGIQKKDLEKEIESALEIYNAYLNGNVYAFVLKEKVPVLSDKPEHRGLYAENEIDSIYGIYGIEELKYYRDEFPDEAKPLFDEIINNL